MSKAVDMVLDLREKIGKDKLEWCFCTLIIAKCRVCEHTERLQGELTDLAQKLKDIDDDRQQVKRDLELYRENEWQVRADKEYARIAMLEG